MSAAGSSPWLRKRRTDAASSASCVVTAPPSPVVTTFRGWNERQPIVPSPPQGMPRQRAPSAPAASSISTTSGGTAFCNSSQSSGRPKRCTASTAFVRGVTASYDRGEVEVEGRRIDVDEHGRRPGEADDARGRRERVRGHQDLVSLADSERQDREVERSRAVRDRDGVLDPARLRNELLELLHLRPHRQRTRLEDLANGLQLGLAELRER